MLVRTVNFFVFWLSQRGVFDYSVRDKLFLHGLNHEIPKGAVVARIVFDFAMVQTVSSSGMALMLMVKEQYAGRYTDVRIINSSEEVRRCLLMAKFNDLFKME